MAAIVSRALRFYVVTLSFAWALEPPNVRDQFYFRLVSRT